MPSGLAALLDDVASIARLAATSVDDVTAASAKAGSKAVGVVIDDAAVTPRYAHGLSPARELPIIWRIAKGSIFNKLVILLPAAVLLGWLAPWAITPILMVGGAYLSFEGAEKILETLGLHGAHGHETEVDPDANLTGTALENSKATAAIRTDLILSAEIMAIALSDVADRPIFTQIVSLALVAVLITFLVYGAVGFIVKMDDMGLALARGPRPWLHGFGRGLVKAMPTVLTALAGIGIVAMTWVGGGILLHGLDHFGLHAAHDLLHGAEHVGSSTLPFAPGIGGWAGGAIVSAIAGLIAGSVLALVVPSLVKAFRR